MMGRALRSAFRQALAWSMLLLAAGCASAAGPAAIRDMAPPTVTAAQSTDAALPVELHGFWVSEPSNCPAPDGGYDGDLMLEISTDRIVGYEEVRKPVAVTRIADRNGWRIESLIDVGPSGIFEPGGVQLFALDGKVLVVEDGNLVNRYRRCPTD